MPIMKSRFIMYKSKNSNSNVGKKTGSQNTKLIFAIYILFYLVPRHETGLYLIVVQMEWLIAQKRQDSYISH